MLSTFYKQYNNYKCGIQERCRETGKYVYMCVCKYLCVHREYNEKYINNVVYSFAGNLFSECYDIFVGIFGLFLFQVRNFNITVC